MEARALFELSKKMQDGPKQLINSFFDFLNPKEHDLVFFKDFKSYLNKNILWIKPNIENPAKSDVDLFIQLTTDPAIKIILNRRNMHVRATERFFNKNKAKGKDYIYLNSYKPLLHSLIEWSFYFTRDFMTKRIEILISEGADINIQNKFWQSPLMYAADRGNSFCLQKLLDLKADINYDNGRYTAIDYAVRSNEKNTLRILFFKGAKLNYDIYENDFKKLSKSTLQLINELKTFKWLCIEDILIKKIDEATTKTLPLDLVKMIASYDARASSCGYFKVIKENAEEKYIPQEFKETCVIM